MTSRDSEQAMVGEGRAALGDDTESTTREEEHEAGSQSALHDFDSPTPDANNRKTSAENGITARSTRSAENGAQTANADKSTPSQSTPKIESH